MTETELTASLPPLLRIAHLQGENAALNRWLTTREQPPARAFSDAPLTAAPVAGDSGLTADDLPQIARYFSAEADGAYPGEIHREFGCTVKQFADAANMIRKQSAGGWQWVPRVFAGAPEREIRTDAGFLVPQEGTSAEIKAWEPSETGKGWDIHTLKPFESPHGWVWSKCHNLKFTVTKGAELLSHMGLDKDDPDALEKLKKYKADNFHGAMLTPAQRMVVGIDPAPEKPDWRPDQTTLPEDFYASEHAKPPHPLAAKFDGIDQLSDEHAELVSDALRANCQDTAALDALLAEVRSGGRREFADAPQPSPAAPKVDEQLAQLASPQHARTRFGGDHPQADHGLRESLASELAAGYRDHEAGLLRDRNQHVTVDSDRIVPARYTLAHIRGSLQGMPVGFGVSWPGTANHQLPDDAQPFAVINSPGQPPAIVHAADAPQELTNRLSGRLGADQQPAVDAVRSTPVDEPDFATIHKYAFKPKSWTRQGDPSQPSLGVELETSAAPQYTPEEQQRQSRRAELEKRRNDALDAWTHSRLGNATLEERQQLWDAYHRANTEYNQAGPATRQGARLPFYGSREHMRHAATQVLGVLNRGLPHEGFAFLKEDASIKGKGFEIVTHPATLDVHKERWWDILSDKVPGLASNSEKYNTGLHVHVGRDALTELGVGKMLAFVNAGANKDFIEAIARRPSNAYARLDPSKKPSDARLRNANRYEAVNLQNPKTVEFRIFGGTTKPGEFFTSLEFVDALSHFVRPGGAGLNEMIGTDSFFRFIGANRKRYPGLYRFAKEYAYQKGMKQNFADELPGDMNLPPVQMSVALQFEHDEDGEPQQHEQQFAAPPTPTPGKGPTPIATATTTQPLNTVDQNLIQFRKQIRSKNWGVNGAKPHSPEERLLLHNFVKQRGLKVAKSPVTMYDEGSDTLYHPTPEDPHAVMETYLKYGTGAVKFAEGDDPDAEEFAQPQPAPAANPLLTASLHELDAIDKPTYFAHRRALKPRERAQFTARIEGREPGTPLPAREQDWEQHKKNLRTVYAATQVPRTKESREADRYRDVARRRRVLAAIKAEAELAQGIGGHHLPDSEPVDVLYLHDPTGKPITDPQHVKQTLAVRAKAVERLNDPTIDDAQRAFLQKVLATPAHGFEVKTLQKTNRQHVQMNPTALAAKKRWSERYGIPVHVAAADLRRGKKNTGVRWRVAPNTIAPTTALASMRPVSTIGETLDHVQGNAVETPKTFAEPNAPEPAPQPRTPHEGHAAFQSHIAKRPTDRAARAVYADWIEDHDPQSVDPEGRVLHFLRNHEGAAWSQLDASGNVRAGRKWTMPEIKAANQSVGGKWFDPGTMRHWGTKLLPKHTYSGPHGTYFVHEGDNFDNTARIYRVAHFQPNIGRVDDWSMNHGGADGREFAPHETYNSLETAATLAQQLAAGTSPYPKNRHWNEAEQGPEQLPIPPKPFTAGAQEQS